MIETVSILSVQLGIFAFLAIKCCALHFAMRGESSLGWLTGALLSAVAMSIAFELLPTSPFEAAIGFIGTPAALFCIANAVRLIARDDRRYATFWAAVATVCLACTSLLLLGTPYLIVGSLFKLTLAVAALEPVYRLLQRDHRSAVDRIVMACAALLAATFFFRLPFWWTRQSLSSSVGDFTGSSDETAFLYASGALASLYVLILIGRGLMGFVGDLRTLSQRDEQTGLLRREYFMSLAQEQRGRFGALLYCDLDCFKDVNDRYGHARGDAVIEAVSKALRDVAPVSGRVGGDEFAVLLPRASAHAAHELAERLRRRVSEQTAKLNLGELAPTMSVGVGVYSGEEDLSRILARADDALYAAKRSGRNRTVMLVADVNGAIEQDVGMQAPAARTATV